VHVTFKDFIRKHRPAVDIDQVSTGETWLASDALALGLCDSISTSDDYLLQLSKTEGTEVYNVKYSTAKKRFMQSLLQPDDDEDASQLLRSLGDDSVSSFIATQLAQIISKTVGHLAQQESSPRISSSHDKYY
jgi:ClpP class serine protease